jgi:segregation and condensation protein A
MAAMLLEIKSRMLLPRPAKADSGEPEDPRAELVRRLLEYERMKLAAARIDALPQANRDYEWISVWIGDQVAERLPDVSLHDLQVAWLALMKQAKMKAHHKIRREELSVREYMGSILRGLRGRGYVVFEDLFEIAAGHSTVASLVVSFLAVLELAREKLIEITQSEALAPIYVKYCDVDDLPLQA